MIEINGIKISDVVANKIPEWRNDVLKKDEDKFIIVDGGEGTGKSSLAMQLASALDPNFNLSKVAFNSIQFDKIIKDLNRKKGDCIVLDEGYGAVNSRATMSKVNKSMVTLGTEMRQLNLFIIIVLPSFFDLDKYFAMWRSDLLFHVHKRKDGSRGRYVIYPENSKKNLYIEGKKKYNYFAVSAPYQRLQFNKGYGVLDDYEYRKKKAEAFRDTEQQETSVQRRYKGYIITLFKILHEEFGLSDEKIGKYIGLQKMRVNTLRNTPLVSIFNPHKLILRYKTDDEQTTGLGQGF